MVPTPTSDTNLTLMRVHDWHFKSNINCDKSSI
jgi:hypothetical protein